MGVVAVMLEVERATGAGASPRLREPDVRWCRGWVTSAIGGGHASHSLRWGSFPGGKTLTAQSRLAFGSVSLDPGTSLSNFILNPNFYYM